MNGWIWFAIIVVVLLIIFFSLKRKKSSGYNSPVRASGGGLWDAVKDACCIRNR